MGERTPFQELTLQDRFEVAVYRIGVGLAIAATVTGAVLLHRPDSASPGLGTLTLASFSLILAFVGVKEAFCFRLNEGYLAGIVIPLIPLLHAAGAPLSAIRAALSVTAGLLLLFAARKLFQPMHYDVGDK